jgi:hypothetical protein
MMPNRTNKLIQDNVISTRTKIMIRLPSPATATMRFLHLFLPRLRPFAAILFAFAIAATAVGRAQAHSSTDVFPADVDEVVVGTVIEVVIDNRVDHTSFTYRELELDDGTGMPLQGSGAESLRNGERVRVSGRRLGTPLDVGSAEILAPPAAAPIGAFEVQGTLAIAHADDFANGKSRYIYQVRDDASGVTTLSLKSLPAALRRGMRVVVSGQPDVDPSSLRPERITIVSAPAEGIDAKSEMILKSATTNSVLVIMANFNNTIAPSYTTTQAQQVMATNTYSVANYYSDVSYGQQLLNVTVTPWVTMNMAKPSNCPWSTIGSAADAAALAASSSYNVSNYNFVVYLFPSLACGWSGLAYVGFPHKAWINGTGAFATQVISHEMGHNFGLLHAGSLNCGAASIGGSCSVAEYGDPFDTMGNSHAMHFNARQKALLNWIPASSIKTHTSGSANYTLNPLEQAGGSTYAIRIPTASSQRTYWLEFRQPLGFDSPSNPAANFSWPNNGAQIRVASPFEWTAGSDDTEIVDMTPGSGGGFGDAALINGQAFTDSTYGVNVIVTSVSATALTVNVTTAGGASTTTALVSAPNPSTVGANVVFTATVTGTNPTASVNFTDGAASIAGCSAAALSGSGNNRTASCATSGLTAGSHTIVAIYSGDGANAASSSAALSQTVNKATSTTSIASSLTPSLAGNSVTFTATVSGSAPTGTVNFRDGATSITGCAAVALGGSGNIRTATCATSSLSVATHSISAVYGGDGTNNGSTSTTLSQVVNKATSSTTLSSSANPSVAGASVTFTATVTGFAPTGSVNFTDGGASISGCGAVTLAGSGNSRTAQCSTTSLTVATHSIAASYGGDANNIGSGSVTLPQVVSSGTAPALVNPGFEVPGLGNGFQYNPGGPGIGWTFTGNSGVQGNGSAWGASAAPAGTQTAFVQTTAIVAQTINLNAGSYTLSFRAAQRACCVAPYVQPLKVSVDGAQIGALISPASTSFGPYNIAFSVATSGAHTISFAGTDPGDKTSFIDAVTITAGTGAIAATTLASSLNPARRTKSVTFTATVAGNNPTGSVGFTSNGGPIAGCTAVPISGSGNTKSALCTTSFATAGTYSIVASYGGDGGNSPAASAALSEVIKKR